MKTFFLSLFVLVGFSIAASAQRVPGTMNYQAVARDANGKALPNKTIKLRLSILTDAGSNLEYSETRSVTTNALGLFSVAIGDKNNVLEQYSTLHNVSWTNFPMLRVEMDINNGTNFVKMGEQQLSTSPFAFVARHAETVAPKNLYNFLFESTKLQYAPKSSLVPVSFETSRQNSGIIYNTTTYEITIPQTGLYYLYASVGMANTGGLAQTSVGFYKNTYTKIYGNVFEIPALGYGTKSINTVYSLNAGDKIRVQVNYFDGSATSLRVGDTDASSYFGGYLIQ